MPVEDLVVVLIDEILAPKSTLFCNQEIDRKWPCEETVSWLISIGDDVFLDVFRAVEEHVGCGFGFEVVGEPDVERSEIPLVEVVVKSIL